MRLLSKPNKRTCFMIAKEETEATLTSVSLNLFKAVYIRA